MFPFIYRILGSCFFTLANCVHDGRGAINTQANLMRKLPKVSLEDSSAEVGTEATVLKRRFPFYHSTSEMRQELYHLEGVCDSRLSVSQEAEGDVLIDVATVRSDAGKPTNRVFILFGEHSRELISPESGLHLLRVLCGDAMPPDGAPSPSSALQDTEFKLVLNANPRSREEVENGNYCLRANPSGVDLNRNWDEHWGSASDTYDTDPGPQPFSEPETKIFKRLVTAFKPTVFLTVHSGTLGMYMPWAYDMKHMGEKNRNGMLSLLRDLDEVGCQCPYGAAGQEVGYSCPGTCMDWVYDHLATPFSFAFEIYSHPKYTTELKNRWEEKVEAGDTLLLQEGHHLGHQTFLDIFSRYKSDFVQTRARLHERLEMEQDPNSCFELFNPTEEGNFRDILENWAGVYLRMAVRTADELRAGGGHG